MRLSLYSDWDGVWAVFIISICIIVIVSVIVMTIIITIAVVLIIIIIIIVFIIIVIMIIIIIIVIIIIPPHNEVVKVLVSLCPSVCQSVRPAFRVRSVAPTVLVRSFSYFYILSSNFRRIVACKVCCKIWIFGNFLKFVTLTLSSFDLGSDVNH